MLGNWWLKQLREARRGQIKRQPIRNQRRRSYRLHLERLELRVQPTVNLLSHFAALNFSQSGGFVPPDTCGAAGSGNDFVETVNQTVKIFNKTTGAAVGSDSFGHFLFTTGG